MSRTVSLLPQKSIGKYGIQDSEKAAVGTPLHIVDFDDIISACRSQKAKSDKKHQFGAIYAYKQNKLGVTEDSVSGGIIFCDIDNISKQVAKEIYNKFDDLTIEIPFLYACCYSSSYTISNDHAGLHFFLNSDELTRTEYSKYAKVCLFTIARKIYNLLGYDLVGDKKLRVDKNKQIIDTHNCSIAQKLYLFYDDFQVNDFEFSITPDTYDFLFGKLEEKYPQFFKKDESVSVSLNNNVEITGSCKKKIELHYGQDYTIANYLVATGKYTKDELLSILLSIESRPANQMKSNGEKTIESHFRQIINTAFAKYGSGSSVPAETKIKAEKLLNQVGFIVVPNIEANSVDITQSVKESQSVYCIKQGHYISEFYDIITQHIDKYQRVCIQAPTGVGKTTIINGFETTTDHGNELLSVQQSGIMGIAKQYHADVVVPFNANNYLYSNLHEVSSMNGEKYDKTQCNVMVIDQYLKHFEESGDKPVIIDESHILYMDRTYRDAVAKLMVLLKQSAKKIICISATPTGEIEELHLVPLKFTNERDNINVTFVETDNIFQAEWNIIRSYMSATNYDRIIVLDNRNNMKIAEECYFIPEYIGNYTVIRKETIEEPKNPFHNDYIQFKKNELLNKKLTLCTCVAYNGINFKNDDEKVLVLCSFTEGDTLSSELIQIIGRVRKSKVDCLVFHDSNYHSEATELSEQIENAIKYESYVQQNQVKDEFLSYNRRLLDKDIREALIRIDTYKKDNAILDKVKQALVDTGYIILHTSKYTTNTKKRVNLKKKAKESQYFLQLLRDTTIDLEKLPVTNENDEESNYMTQWRKDVLFLVSNYEGITREFILELTDNSSKNKLIETTLEYLKDVCRICTISEQDYIHYNDCMPYLIQMYKDNSLELKRISTNHRRICNMYDNWKSKISEKRNVEVVDELLLEFIKSDVKIKYAEYISKCVEGGAKGRAYKKISDGTNTYNSVSECADKYNVPVSTISKALLKNKALKRGPLKGITFSYI